MKKTVILIAFFFLASCSSIDQQEQNNINKEFRKNFVFYKIEDSKITKTNQYSLQCSSQYYENLSINTERKISATVSKGNEEFVLYVDGAKAKLFGADFEVLGDNAENLIIMRYYLISGLIETFTINKETGFAINSKTKAFDLSGNYPSGDIYLFFCQQI